MKAAIIFGILLGCAGIFPSAAADVTLWRERAVTAPTYLLLPPPRSSQAQTVWASTACWRGCEQQCGWRFQACLNVDAPGNCAAQTDACDRSCQSSCRTYGGPLLNLAN
jgi:hypothetical protein